MADRLSLGSFTIASGRLEVALSNLALTPAPLGENCPNTAPCMGAPASAGTNRPAWMVVLGPGALR
jgi:hypothetical protein